MIKIEDKSKCCGCEACVQICPKRCISFTPDDEGFFYPSVDEEKCVDCGMCEKVCPELDQDAPRQPKQTFAAKNPDEAERQISSSGGIFAMLARKVIKEGGVVFGARFDDTWDVIHSSTASLDGISPFMGSKYVQSRIGDSFLKVRQFLKDGRKVMFSGTPCQIAGLRKFLQQEYDNLLTVDILCHGVPSPAVWRKYLDEVVQNVSFGKSCDDTQVSRREGLEYKKISFRDKRTGWKKFSMSFTLASHGRSDKEGETVTVSRIHREDPYFQGFNNYSLFLRKSCAACPVRELRSGSDITLGDFWFIETLIPEMDDDKGVSVVLANTLKGVEEINSLGAELINVDFEEVVRRNRAIKNVFLPRRGNIEDIIRYRRVLPTKRDYFFYDSSRTVTERVKRLGKPKLDRRIKNALIKIYKRISNH